MIVARRYVIAGRVQGVGFRVFTEATAVREGVHGFVRNLPDGRVEAFVEGDQESVDRVELKLRRGPAGARIESVEVEPAAPAATAPKQEPEIQAAASKAPSTRRSKFASMSCVTAPSGTLPAKVIDWSCSLTERMVRTTGVSPGAVRRLNGNSSPVAGNPAACSPRYFL